MFAEAERIPIRFGIGIHAGEVIIGDIGYRDTIVFTALGDTVNVTARLEEMTKELGCQVVLSDEVRKKAGMAADALPSVEIDIRGRADPIVAHTAIKAETLSTILDTAEVVESEPIELEPLPERGAAAQIA
jgi:adenylate cyclase